MLRYTCIILLITLMLNFNAYAGKDLLTLTSNIEEQAVGVDGEEIYWLDEYTEVLEPDLYKEIENSKVGLKSGVLNTQTGSLYLVTSNGSKYKVRDASSQLLVYVKLQGIEIENLAFSEEVLKDTESNDTMSKFIMVLMLITVLGGLIWLVVKERRTEVKAVAGYTREDLRAKDSDGVPKVKFDDIEGIEELKSDIIRLVDALKNPDKYLHMGARVPKGVILYGPPGTGKTLLAKAIAGEAGVPFFSMVGSDFIEKYVGVGASRVRELYAKAKKSAPCIVFIDEIDAVAGQRGRDENSERDQTINALLSELDGFDKNTNIITICATNRLDMLDEAFKRAGRFDLKLAVGLPDRRSRRKILQIHSRCKLLSDCVNLDNLATKTVGFSGAELETLLNEAALLAVSRNKKALDNEDIDDAYFKLVMQGNKKKRDGITETNRIVAWHESGHTLATKLLTDDSVSSVTIIGSASGAGGCTFRITNEEDELKSKQYLENLIQVMYAGRAAEELYFKDKDKITIGASQDIRQATSIIKEYISSYGMGSRGMLDLSQFSKEYNTILEESSKLSELLYTRVLSLLDKNKELLEKLANELLKNETLSEEEIDAIIYAVKRK